MKAESPGTLTLAKGSSLLYWGNESRRSQSSSFSFLAMLRKAVIGGAPDGDWYDAHAMDRLGSLRAENAERKICRCASSRSRLEVEAVAPKSEAFRASLAASLAVNTSAECRRRKEECGGTMGL